MKRCPECRRDYYDDTLIFCLDDGARLLDGPSLSEKATELFPASRQAVSSGHNTDRTDVVTAILPSRAVSGGRSSKMFWILAGLIAASVAIAAYAYFYAPGKKSKAETANTAIPTPAAKLYWEMSDEEKSAFTKERAKQIQQLIGDEPVELDNDAMVSIATELEYYVRRRDSLSQKPMEEGLRAIFGRGSQYAPTIIKAYEMHSVPPALGVYQAMV